MDQNSVNAGVASSEEDVQGDSSTPNSDVTVSSTGSDRTPEQMFRELQRKQAAQDQKLDQVLQYIASNAQPRQTVVETPKTAKEQMSDEDLWALAQAGDYEAFTIHQGRIADRRYAAQSQAANRQNITDNQLRALFTRYPMLRDPSHPLTQVVNQAYSLYVQNGYPQGKETMLEAAKTAIADSPELIAQIQATVPREAVRQNGVRSAQSGVTGVTHRSSPQIPQKQLKVTPEEAALAKRMGVKDPLKAKKNFLERNSSGQSQLGAVAAFVNTEDF